MFLPTLRIRPYARNHFLLRGHSSNEVLDAHYDNLRLAVLINDEAGILFFRSAYYISELSPGSERRDDVNCALLLI